MIANFSDALNVELIDLLKDTLTGIKYDRNTVKAALDGLKQAHTELAAQVDDFEQWLVGEMES